MRTSDKAGSERTGQPFATTHWSVVLAAGDSESPDAAAALEVICRAYWHPLYAFIRMKGFPAEDAKDLTQAFFERLLQNHAFRRAVPEKGRFRSYLLTLLHRFLCDQLDYSHAAKRGGGAGLVALDTVEAEQLFEQAASSCQSPEAVFERAWAETVVQTSVERLRAEFEADGKGAQFQQLKAYLSFSADRAAYTATGWRLGLSADAVAMAVMRMRRRFRALVRAEVANTVATPAEIDDEMRYLVSLLVA